MFTPAVKDDGVAGVHLSIFFTQHANGDFLAEVVQLERARICGRDRDRGGDEVVICELIDPFAIHRDPIGGRGRQPCAGDRRLHAAGRGGCGGRRVERLVLHARVGRAPLARRVVVEQRILEDSLEVGRLVHAAAGVGPAGEAHAHLRLRMEAHFARLGVDLRRRILQAHDALRAHEAEVHQPGKLRGIEGVGRVDGRIGRPGVRDRGGAAVRIFCPRLDGRRTDRHSFAGLDALGHDLQGEFGVGGHTEEHGAIGQARAAGLFTGRKAGDHQLVATVPLNYHLAHLILRRIHAQFNAIQIGSQQHDRFAISTNK
ncbi:MAG: hypothetical protein WHX53_12595 [Anaerolineae bacterium]